MPKMSSQKLQSVFEEELHRSFFQVIADLSTVKESRVFLEDFLGRGEMDMLTKRLAIAAFLNDGKNYTEIGKILHVSSATIATVAEKTNAKGMKLALQKMKVDKWASSMSKKFLRMFAKSSPKSKK